MKISTFTETEGFEQLETADLNKLTGAHRRTAYALGQNVISFCDHYGLGKVGFLTLTFADHVIDAKEASRRFRSLNNGVLKKRYNGFIRVFERQESGRIHYHLLVALDHDIRTGLDHVGIRMNDYDTASQAIRDEWAFWRRTAKRYGFGRTELLPVRSTAEAIGRYVGKYISKHIGNRKACDKGVRLIGYSRGKGDWRPPVGSRFSWAGGNSRLWRKKTNVFAEIHQVNDLDGMTRKFGPGWAYRYQDAIMGIDLVKELGSFKYLNGHEALADMQLQVLDMAYHTSYEMDQPVTFEMPNGPRNPEKFSGDPNWNVMGEKYDSPGPSEEKLKEVAVKASPEDFAEICRIFQNEYLAQQRELSDGNHEWVHEFLRKYQPPAGVRVDEAKPGIEAGNQRNDHSAILEAQGQ